MRIKLTDLFKQKMLEGKLPLISEEESVHYFKARIVIDAELSYDFSDPVFALTIKLASEKGEILGQIGDAVLVGDGDTVTVHGLEVKSSFTIGV